MGTINFQESLSPVTVTVMYKTRLKTENVGFLLMLGRLKLGLKIVPRISLALAGTTISMAYPEEKSLKMVFLWLKIIHPALQISE